MKRWLAAGLVSFGLFVALGFAVAPRPLGIDMSVAGAFEGLWRGTLGRATTIVSDVLGLVVPAVLMVGVLLGAALAWYRHARREAGIALRVLVVYLPARAVSALGKPLFVRNRPRTYAEFSYPSGHVVSVASAGLALVLLCAWLAPRLARWVALGAGVATVLVALTRLLLGVHWLTDTVGAVLGVLGVGLVFASVLRLLPRSVSAPAPTA